MSTNPANKQIYYQVLKMRTSVFKFLNSFKKEVKGTFRTIKAAFEAAFNILAEREGFEPRS
jgi:hypothetical protein